MITSLSIHHVKSIFSRVVKCPEKPEHEEFFVRRIEVTTEDGSTFSLSLLAQDPGALIIGGAS